MSLFGFAFSKNGKSVCIECSICCCSLSLTLPPRAQYTPHQLYLIFRLTFSFSSRSAIPQRPCACVRAVNISRTYGREDLIKFPFSHPFFSAPSSLVCGWLFGPEESVELCKSRSPVRRVYVCGCFRTLDSLLGNCRRWSCRR